MAIQCKVFFKSLALVEVSLALFLSSGSLKGNQKQLVLLFWGDAYRVISAALTVSYDACLHPCM